MAALHRASEAASEAASEPAFDFGSARHPVGMYQLAVDDFTGHEYGKYLMICRIFSIFSS
jgi:hypothetical protein